jgi:hypothetical protein
MYSIILLVFLNFPDFVLSKNRADSGGHAVLTQYTTQTTRGHVNKDGVIR